MDAFFVFIALLACALKGLFYGAGSFMILERITGSSRYSLPIRYVGWVIGMTVMIVGMNAKFLEQRNRKTAEFCQYQIGEQYIMGDGTLSCVSHGVMANQRSSK